MSLLDDESIVLDNMEKNSHIIEKDVIQQFINNHMSQEQDVWWAGDWMTKPLYINLVYYSVDLNNSNEIIMDTIEPPSDPRAIKCTRHEIRCTRSAIYETQKHEHIIVPCLPDLPMLMINCTNIPNYIKFGVTKLAKVNHPIIKCIDSTNSNDVKNYIKEFNQNFRYTQALNNYDIWILRKIYSDIGYYDNNDMRVINYQARLFEEYSK